MSIQDIIGLSIVALVIIWMLSREGTGGGIGSGYGSYYGGNCGGGCGGGD
tara:strand:- start:1070 stop:1219 length:150 start_codon:yes stop_codon:yes gene_type:complete